MRDRRSKDRLVRARDMPLAVAPVRSLLKQAESLQLTEEAAPGLIPNEEQLRQILKSKGLESESKIKGYIVQLESVLTALKGDAKQGRTDRKKYRPCGPEDNSGKNTLRIYGQAELEAADTSRHGLVQEIILKAKQQRRPVNLK